MKNLFTLFFMALIFTGCEIGKECPDAAVGPVRINFEVVHKTTSENVFTTGEYVKSQIQIKDQNGAEVEFDFNRFYDSKNILVIIGWGTKTDIYTVTIGANIQFEIHFATKETKGECNSITRLTSLEVQGVDSEKDGVGGIVGTLLILVP